MTRRDIVATDWLDRSSCLKGAAAIGTDVLLGTCSQEADAGDVRGSFVAITTSLMDNVHIGSVGVGAQGTHIVDDCF